jgi:hypothetical protein
MDIERTTPANDGTIRWKKLGGGSFRGLPNRIIKPGEIFRARPDQISENFRDIIVPLDPLPDQIAEDNKLPETENVTPLPGYSKKKVEDEDLWDIYDGLGKKVNEKSFTEEKADEILRSLS